MGNHRWSFLKRDAEQPRSRLVSRLEGETDEEKFDSFLRQQKRYSRFSLVLAIVGLSLLVISFALSEILDDLSNASFVLGLVVVIATVLPMVSTIVSLTLLRERRVVLRWRGSDMPPEKLLALDRYRHMNQISAFAYPASWVILLVAASMATSLRR